MSKIKVTPAGGWPLHDKGTVEYYDIGRWSMELITDELDDEIEAAKEGIQVYKAWHKFLKQQAKERKCYSSVGRSIK